MNAQCPLASLGAVLWPRGTRHEPEVGGKSKSSTIPLWKKSPPDALFSFRRPAARTRKCEARSGRSSNKAGARPASDQVRGDLQLAGIIGKTIGLPAPRSALQLQSGLGMDDALGKSPHYDIEQPLGYIS